MCIILLTEPVGGYYSEPDQSTSYLHKMFLLDPYEYHPIILFSSPKQAPPFRYSDKIL